MWSVGLICEIGTEHGLNFLPLMWLVQAWQTPMPQPYFGPRTPRTSRRTHRTRTSPSTSALTRLPLRMKEWTGTAQAPFLVLRRLRLGFGGVVTRVLSLDSPSVGDCGIGGTVGNGSKSSGCRWLRGNSVGVFPIARAYAHATAAIVVPTPNSPTPPGL